MLIRSAGVPRDPIIPLPDPPLPAEETPEEEEEPIYAPAAPEPGYDPVPVEPGEAPAEPALP
jgi:hypothetical protein